MEEMVAASEAYPAACRSHSQPCSRLQITSVHSAVLHALSYHYTCMYMLRMSGEAFHTWK
jgi:hypothetical protein